MPTTATAKITTVGLAAAVSAHALSVSVAISHVVLGAGGGGYTPTGAETALVDRREKAAVLIGAASGAQLTLSVTFLAALYAGAAYNVAEIGFYIGDPDAGGTLFAVISAPSMVGPLRGPGSVTNYTQTFALALSGVPAGSVTVTFDPTESAALIALAAHLAAADPHTQYLEKAGGTMTGALALAGNAMLPLQAVPLQQLLAAFGSDITANGYFSLPTGHIVKYGHYDADIAGSSTAEGTATITFPVAFPTACFVVMVTGRNPSLDGLADAGLDVVSESTTGFEVTTRWSGGSGSNVAHGLFYIAIGH